MAAHAVGAVCVALASTTSRPRTRPRCPAAAAAARRLGSAPCLIAARLQPSRPRRAAAARSRAAMPPVAQIDVLVADIGGTNCRFQVWALDSFFRPSRMVVEKVGLPPRLPPPPACRRSCPRRRRFIEHASHLPRRPQFYATKDYAHFRDALAELLKLPELRWEHAAGQGGEQECAVWCSLALDRLPKETLSVRLRENSACVLVSYCFAFTPVLCPACAVAARGPRLRPLRARAP